MAPKTDTAPSTVPKRPTPLDRLAGAVVVTTFICIWLSSVASPFFLLQALRNGRYLPALGIVSVAIASYAPWEPGLISRAITRLLNRYHGCYYRSLSIEYEAGDGGVGLPSESDPQTFYAVHPHGAFCIGWAFLFSSPEMRHVRFCFAPSLYLSPFFRLFSRCVGRPGSASRPAMQSYLRAGESVALPPGGFEEATLTSTSHDRVFIKKRTGFIKMCLMHGVPRVRPVYAFGERSLFWNVQGMWGPRLALNRFGIPTILVWGRWFCPLVPRNDANMRIVVGRPLKLPHIKNPTKEDVALWHEKYIAELRRLFDDHKEDALGTKEAKVAKLEVW